MAPKGKKTGGVKSKGSSTEVVDGVSTTEMTREQLEQHATRLRIEMEREREERHFFQLERDKLRTFWEITRQQLLETRAEIRNKEQELEEKEECHEDQNRIFKQKLKHLLYEHHLKIAELKAENMVSLKVAQDDFDEQEKALLSDKRNIKQSLHEQGIKHEEVIRQLKIEFSETLSKTQKDLETQRFEIESRYEKLLQSQQNELCILHKMEIAEINERKNKQIADLVKHHEKAFIDMKTYYNDITLNNLALISSLKEQIKEVKVKEERMEKTLREIGRENRKLTEPMKKVEEESIELAKQLLHCKKNMESLYKAKKALVITKKELETVKWDNQKLENELEKIEKEKNELNSKLLRATIEIQQKSNLKNLILEKKLKALKKIAEQKEEPSEKLMAGSGDTQILPPINFKEEDLINEKDAIIYKLEAKLTELSKAYDKLLETNRAMVVKYNISDQTMASIDK